MSSSVTTAITIGIGCITVGVLYAIWQYSSAAEKDKNNDQSKQSSHESQDMIQRDTATNTHESRPTLSKTNEKKQIKQIGIKHKDKSETKPPKLSKLTSVANLTSSFNKKEIDSLAIDLTEYLLILSNWYRYNMALKVYLSKDIINVILNYSKYKIKIFDFYNPFLVDTFIQKHDKNDDINCNVQIIKNVQYSVMSKEKRKEIGLDGSKKVLLISSKTIKELDPVTKIKFNFSDKITYMDCIIGYVSRYDKNYVINNKYAKSIIDETTYQNIGYYKLDIRETYGNYQFGSSKYEYSYRQRRGKCQTEADPIDKNEKIMTMKYKRGFGAYKIQFYVKGQRVFSSRDLSSAYDYYYFIQFPNAMRGFSVSVANGTDQDFETIPFK